MAFLRSTIAADPPPDLIGRRVRLRMPESRDFAQWSSLRAESRDHLAPWEPQWAADELTRAAFRRRLRRYQWEMQEDLGYAFLIFRRDDDALLGGITLSNVRRGVSQAAAIGYWMGLPHAGQGYMTDAVRTVTTYVFDTLALHRLEAACIPSNGASIRVLQACGFVREGLARQYLKINGAWQDHMLFALLASDRSGGGNA